MSLAAVNISKEFIRAGKGTNRFEAVKEMSLSIEKGTVTVLKGRSGSGKTTLLNMLSGLLLPTKGKVIFEGTDIYSHDDRELSDLRNKHFGVIPQGQTALHSLTVYENILLPFTIYSDDPNEAYAKKLMEDLDIAHLAEIRPRELSGGELRRMAVARAVVRCPDVIFADEPTGDLDDENTAKVFETLTGLAAEGAAVFIVTHENDAEKYADRLYRMDSGKLEKL
jgi:putative ABC transport system ATP-binding protein